MDICIECGAPVDTNGLTNCEARGEKCAKDRAAFLQDVEDTKSILDLHKLAMIERNEMPACFLPTRAMGVALAQLLMEALRQNQELLKQVPKH